MTSRRVATGVSAFAVSVLMASSAWAQRESGPYGALFGGKDQSVTQSLALNWSLYSGYDDTLLDQARALAFDPRYQVSGGFAGGQAGLGYSLRQGSTQFTLDTSTMVRRYSSTGDISTPTVNLSSGLVFGLGPRVTVHGDVGGSYASFYQFAPFELDTGAVPSFSLAAVSAQSIVVSSGGGISANLTQRISLVADVAWQDARFVSAEAGRVTSRRASFRLQEKLTRDLGWHAGYGYREGIFNSIPTAGAGAIVHDLDIGLDYAHALSVSRRTSITFGSGSSITEPQAGVKRYSVSGHATLSKDIGRTWSSSVSYARGTQMIQGFSDVVLSDSVNGTLGGLLLPRLQLSVGAGYSVGEFVVDPTAPRYGTETANGRLGLAISQSVMLTAEYVYYRYNVPPGAFAVPDAVAPRMARQSIIVGVNGRVPFLNERSHRDSR